MDWAVKFPLVGYQETQSKRSGIKTKSVVSVVVKKIADCEVEMIRMIR